MAVTLRPKPISRALLLGVSLTLLAGCDIFGGKDDATNDANKDAANYKERSVEAIYADGWRAINNGAWDICAAQFNEVERQHPYSVWARRAMLISAFCSYQANDYTASIATSDQYISLHPGSPEVAWRRIRRRFRCTSRSWISAATSPTPKAHWSPCRRGAALPRHRICP